MQQLCTAVAVGNCQRMRYIAAAFAAIPDAHVHCDLAAGQLH